MSESDPVPESDPEAIARRITVAGPPACPVDAV